MTDDKPMTVDVLMARHDECVYTRAKGTDEAIRLNETVLRPQFRAAIEQYGKEQYARGANDVAIYSAEQAQIEAPLRAEIDRLNAQRRELQAERERLLDSLARSGLEASRMVLKERDRCAKAAAPESIPYSDDEWRVRCEVRDAILDA